VAFLGLAATIHWLRFRNNLFQFCWAGAYALFLAVPVSFEHYIPWLARFYRAPWAVLFGLFTSLKVFIYWVWSYCTVWISASVGVAVYLHTLCQVALPDCFGRWDFQVPWAVLFKVVIPFEWLWNYCTLWTLASMVVVVLSVLSVFFKIYPAQFVFWTFRAASCFYMALGNNLFLINTGRERNSNVRRRRERIWAFCTTYGGAHFERVEGWYYRYLARSFVNQGVEMLSDVINSAAEPVPQKTTPKKPAPENHTTEKRKTKQKRKE